MSARRFETTAAFQELMDLVRNADAVFLEGPRAVDDPSVLEGYRMLTEILQVSLDCYLWADTARPSIVPIVGPFIAAHDLNWIGRGVYMVEVAVQPIERGLQIVDSQLLNLR